MSSKNAKTVVIATLIQMSIGPSASSVAVGGGVDAPRRPRRRRAARAPRAPAPSASRAAASRPSRSRATRARRIPGAAKRRAVARPIPLDAPVMTTVGMFSGLPAGHAAAPRTVRRPTTDRVPHRVWVEPQRDSRTRTAHARADADGRLRADPRLRRDRQQAHGGAGRARRVDRLAVPAHARRPERLRRAARLRARRPLRARSGRPVPARTGATSPTPTCSRRRSRPPRAPCASPTR